MMTLLSLEHISKSYRQVGGALTSGEPPLLHAVNDVSLTISSGETIGIAGESGCGKSTLAKIASGLLSPDLGQVFYQGTALKNMNRQTAQDFRRSVQMVFQDPFSSLNPRIRIGDAIAEPLRLHAPQNNATCFDDVLRLMETVGLNRDHYDRFPHEFSGGQRQRIGIARALAASPKLLIADEPVSALDISIQAQILNLLLALKTEQGLTCMIISHDLAVLHHLCDYLCIMYQGTIVEELPAAKLSETAQHPYTRMLLASTPNQAPTLEIPLTHATLATTSSKDCCPYLNRCPWCHERCLRERPTLVAQKNLARHRVACHALNDPLDNKK